jgi:hypothetical protein
MQARRVEAEGLPWGLRPLEISAAVRASQLAERAPPRVLGVCGGEPRVRELDERPAELKADVE